LREQRNFGWGVRQERSPTRPPTPGFPPCDGVVGAPPCIGRAVRIWLGAFGENGPRLARPPLVSRRATTRSVPRQSLAHRCRLRCAVSRGSGVTSSPVAKGEAVDQHHARRRQPGMSADAPGAGACRPRFRGASPFPGARGCRPPLPGREYVSLYSPDPGSESRRYNLPPTDLTQVDDAAGEHRTAEADQVTGEPSSAEVHRVA
jgi:hypothetical protein